MKIIINDLKNAKKEEIKMDGFGQIPLIKGESAYELAVKHGFIGTEDEWIKSLKYDDTKIKEDISNKVDKVEGKGLSSNDFTTEEKEKLAKLSNYDDTEIRNEVSNKVEKVAGKMLSSNDFTNKYKNKLDELNNYDDTKIKEELEEVKEENTRLKEDLNALPTVQGNGEYVTLDTAECRFKKIHIEGKSEQETRSGKNKFNLNYIEKSAAKVVTDTGVNLTNCWGTQAFNNEKVLKTFKPNTTYTMKAKAKVVSRPSTQGEHLTSTLLLYRAGSSALGLVSVDLIKMKDKETIALNTEKEYVMTFTTPADLSEVRLLTYSFYGNNDGSTTYAPSGEIDLTDIMLVEGTYTMDNFPSYEPYGVSPSPEYPSKIRNVGDNINWFDFNKQYSSINKANVSIVDKNTFSVTSTFLEANASVAYILDVEKNMNYCLNGEIINGNFARVGIQYRIDGSSNWANYATVFTGVGEFNYNISTNSYSQIRLLFYSQYDKVTEIQNAIFKCIQLTKGLTLLPYSPYGKGSINIKIQNENLLDIKELVKMSDNYSEVENGYTFNFNMDMYNTGVALTVPIELPASISYTIKNGTGTNFRLKFWFDDGTVMSLNDYKSGTNTEERDFVINNFTKRGASKIIRIGFDRENMGTFTLTNFMINEGTTVKSYIEHKEQNISFSLDKPLYQNCYLAEDGIHYKKIQIELDGTTDGLKVTNVTKHSNDIYYCVVPTAKKGINGVNNLYCSHFKAAFEVEIGQCYVTGAGSGIVFILNDQTITTPKAANDWLAEQKEAGNPVTIEYELATEEIVPYTEEQKQQWEQLKNARSYEGQTHILSTDEISPDFNITARANLSEILNKLQGE